MLVLINSNRKLLNQCTFAFFFLPKLHHQHHHALKYHQEEVRIAQANAAGGQAGAPGEPGAAGAAAANVEIPDEVQPEPLDMAFPEKGIQKQITYLILFPIIFPLWLTLPDTRSPPCK